MYVIFRSVAVFIHNQKTILNNTRWLTPIFFFISSQKQPINLISYRVTFKVRKQDAYCTCSR